MTHTSHIVCEVSAVHLCHSACNYYSPDMRVQLRDSLFQSSTAGGRNLREKAVDTALELARSAPLDMQGGIRQGAGRIDSLLGGDGPQPVRAAWAFKVGWRVLAVSPPPGGRDPHILCKLFLGGNDSQERLWMTFTDTLAVELGTTWTRGCNRVPVPPATRLLWPFSKLTKTL